MTASLKTVLAKAGLRVDPDEFLTLVEDAARQLSPADPDPADYFNPEQQEALTAVGLDLSPRRRSDGDHRARAVAAQAVLRDSAVTVAEAAETIGVDPSRIRHRLLARRLSGWKERGGWRLPAWQFTSTGVLPGLEAVLEAVPDDQPPLVVAAFMTTSQSDLRIDGEPVSPRAWLLASGDPEPVAKLASTLGTPA
ncbi:MAG TPA: DNA-binding protein [Actinophytocola sp.]|uniref:DNA-binding protein n=1 Tax=Actinophytocola sp. TaxID=1872138 RepID=UPI002DDDA228|nr:DNA-binding protein [Actinophytocola sp.]HEV2779368.1 DNA-binding protein [Actinophytocola sp.]